jgi:transcriptional regulator with XRE-family HTH domain
MNLGKRIDKLRKIKKIPQAELCKGIISSAHLSNIKRGRYQPAEDIMLLLAERLGVPAPYLLQHREEQAQLKLILSELQLSLVQEERDQAKELIRTIRKEYWPIQSTVQEFFYLILETLYLLKFVSFKHALKRYELEIEPLCDPKNVSSLPKEVQESYYGLTGRLAYYAEDYERSCEAFTRQLWCVRDIFEKAHVLYYLGSSLAAVCKRKEGIEAVKQAVTLYEANQQYEALCAAYHLLFTLYLDTENLNEAEIVWGNLDHVVQQENITHLNPLLYQLSGLLKRARKQEQEAITAFQAAISSLQSANDPSDDRITQLFSVNCQLVEALIAVKALDQAQNAFEMARHYQRSATDEIELNILKAKLAFAQEEYEEYHTLLDESLRHFYKQRKWRRVEMYAQELAEHHYRGKHYKLAAQYFRLLAEAIKHQE